MFTVDGDMKRIRYIIYALVLVAAASFLLRSDKTLAIYSPGPQARYIAHAGGGLPEGTYSNSREAIDRSVRAGFTLIEIDFHCAQNDDLIVIHDWNQTQSKYFSTLKLPPALSKLWERQSESEAAFMAQTMSYGLTQISVDGLLDILKDNPGLRIITDCKCDNLANLKTLKQAAGRAGIDQNRFIPQIYDLESFAPVQAMGFEDIILTIYRLNLSGKTIVDFVNKTPLYALTVPLQSISEPLMVAVKDTGVPVFTHTINDPGLAGQMVSMGVAGIYTDYLVPPKAASAPPL